jgi:hypothetical protein
MLLMGGRREPNEHDLIWLIKHGREWVENLQDRYRPLAHPLQGPLKGTLAPFFPAAILDRVQIAEVGVIQNPPFRQPKPDQDPEALVFHELIHVVQYDLLGGVEEFMTRYVYGMRGAGLGLRRSRWKRWRTPLRPARVGSFSGSGAAEILPRNRLTRARTNRDYGRGASGPTTE